jgi:hypothetical protein
VARKPRTVDALSPLDTITGVFASILLTVLALGSVAVVFDDSVTMFGMGRDATVCVDRNMSIGDDGTGELSQLERDDYDLRDGVTYYSNETTICQPDPGVGEVALAGLTESPTPLVFVAFLLLTRRIITYARRHGFFSRPLAERIERLGWLLLLGLIGASVISWIAEGLLVSRMLTDQSWASGSFHISVAGIIGAYGIVSIGRVMARAADLQSDADATI